MWLIRFNIYVLFSFIGPIFSPYADGKVQVTQINKPPSLSHWLGTDQLGRDILTRLMQAGRISLTIGLASMLLSVILGALLGAIAGFIEGCGSFNYACCGCANVHSGITATYYNGSDFIRMEITIRIPFICCNDYFKFSRMARACSSCERTNFNIAEQAFMQAADVLGLRILEKLFII